MFTPTVANSTSYFYALGNTPAINLAKNLPNGVDASLLLLGCGDVRNIVYTAYNEIGLPGRTLDITVNDIDEAILARNIFLFSLLIDNNNVSGNTPWNLYYNLHIDSSDLHILSSQVKKLLKASESLKTWKGSSYGKVLPFCDQATLDDVRAVWVSYENAAASDNVIANSEALTANLKHSIEMKRIAFGNAVAFTGLRSAAPAALQNAQEVTEASQQFWESADATPNGAVSNPNPLFYASLSKHHLLHYGTDPILGFHLAAAFIPLTDQSPLKPDQQDERDRVFSAAKTQFREWAAACGTLLRGKKLVIRSVASEALAFCHTLQHLIVTKETSAGWYRRQFDARVLSLDQDVYGAKSTAPIAFDTVDTSNLADHFGTLNILMSALPLLTPHPWSAVFTETLLKRESTAKEAFDTLLYGHGPTISLLVGASAVEYWTNSTAVSSVDEILIGLSTKSIQAKGDEVAQVHSRITWKQSKLFSGVNASGPLAIESEALASIFFNLYLKVFAHENPMKLLSISKSSVTQLLRNTAYSHFHRGTLVSLLHYLKLRLSVDNFGKTWGALLQKVSAERSLMFTGNLRQDLSVQMHTQGVGSEDWLLAEIKPNRDLGGFDSWTSVPEVVAVTLVVPREKIARVFDGSDQARISSPTIRGSLVSGEDAAHKWHNFYDEVQLVFGTVKSSGDRDTSDFSVTVDADPAGWLGKSPLIATFYVSAAALQVERKTSYVRLEVLSSAQSIAVFSKTLGSELRIFQAKLADEESVFITKYMPGQTRYPAASEAAGLVAEATFEKSKDTESSFTANASQRQDRIETITGHLDILSAKGKKFLTDKLPITLDQVSPFTVNVVFGEKELVYPLTFPTLIDASKAKTRIARTSAYVEVIAPFAEPSSDPETNTVLTDFVYPTQLARGLSNTPADLNTPHLNLDRLPIINVAKKDELPFLNTLLSFEFSVRERALRERINASRLDLAPSPRVNFKESIFTMTMLSTGQQGGQTGLFCLNHPDRGGIHMLFFVSALRLDAASASVVLDAAVLPFTPPIIKKVEPFLLLLRELEMASVTVNDEELILWKKVLPALAERSRTWNHKSSCEYRKAGATIPLSLEPSEPAPVAADNESVAVRPRLDSVKLRDLLICSVMWLLNTKTLALESFTDPSEVGYAILSHTWDNGEVSFQEMTSATIATTTKSKAGFEKVAKTCEIAKEVGLGYAWVDTCCIDKSSSAELSEAINSMFRWYQEAKVCLVLLSDLRPEVGGTGPGIYEISDLSRCRWFTRGWTLQELIAPADVEFYDAGWKLRFSKDTWSGCLSTITNINIDILTFEKELSAVPVAVKMSWAAHRRTTRVEDRAYSLLGLFDIHIPMIYGEGAKAFQRLQEEIAKGTDDLSLFAWVAVDEEQRYRGIFAKELAEFTFCGNYMRYSQFALARIEFSITNKGVRFTDILRMDTEASATWWLPFGTQGNCQICRCSHRIHIGLVFTAEGWVRATPGRCRYEGEGPLSDGLIDICVRKTVSSSESRRLEQRPGHFFKLDWPQGDLLNRHGTLLMVEPSDLWDPVHRGFVGEAQTEDFGGVIKMSLRVLPADVVVFLFVYKAKGQPPKVQLFLIPDGPWELKEGQVFSKVHMELSRLYFSPRNVSSARATADDRQFPVDVTFTAEVDEEMRLIVSCKYIKGSQRAQEQEGLPLPTYRSTQRLSDETDSPHVGGLG
ncbi:MYND finger family protein [Colletotrichum scovillei]|uniref:MYND finger family protein n=2 Tax=Colletotrichum scovillei TaxID=1209932 RepID=A0A9P7QWV7_9PEZI|nr:MYND finger family protein [Colletotrichum scovillei]